ncbi:MAG: hypothetical protein AAFO81_00755 [Pseudomonadota bacterium]
MRYLSVACLLLFVFPPVAHGQRAVVIPEDLQQWQDWVLHDAAEFTCPLDASKNEDGDAHRCLWPETLNINIDAQGARFSQTVTVFADTTLVALPGSTRYWPQSVTANGTPTPVVADNNLPTVFLPPGTHQLRGQLRWTQRPAQLPIPAATGLIALTINGDAVSRPNRKTGSLWLAPRVAQKSSTQDNIETVVHRLVRDGMPTRLITRIALDVSGSVRETNLDAVLPEGFVPVRLNSDLPVRLEADGNLGVQIRPGNWLIELEARGTGTLNTVTLPVSGNNMPTREVWSYSSGDRLRITTASGPTPVDPTQSEVPSAWRALPAFQIVAGQALTIDERSRGKTVGDNRLQLQRTLWRDFDGDGFTFVDTVQGAMTRDWRLDMSAPFALQGASSAGDDLLITRNATDDAAGVELRRSDVQLRASGRVAGQNTLPIAGWDTRFDSVDILVSLPSGTRLLAAPGADYAGGTWFAQWQLIHFFVLLISSVAATRVFGVGIGALTLLTLLLSIHEFNAPQYIWLNLLIAAALVNVAPEGKLRTLVRRYQQLSLVALAFIVVPFALGQLRAAIYPQLDVPGPRFYQGDAFSRTQQARAVVEPEADMVQAMRSSKSGAEQSDEIVVTASRLPAKRYERYAADALVQVGPGVPTWSQVNYRLRWSSPVSADQTMRLVIMPRSLVRVWRVLMVILIGALTAVFILDALKRLQLPRWLRPKTAATTAAVLLALGVSAPEPAIADDLPSGELLEQLKQRLTESPLCAPQCVSMTRADVVVDDRVLRMTLQVDAYADTAAALPGSLEGWRPTDIRINGQRTGRAFRDREDQLYVLVRPGINTIVVTGPLPADTSFTVPFPLPPRAISVDNSERWFIAGIDQQRLVGGALQFTQQQTTTGTEERWSASRFPAFVRVERQLTLGVDWTVSTRVIRESPQRGAFTVDVGLIDGEQVTSEDVRVAQARNIATVPFSDGTRQVSWQSILPRQSPLILTATDAGSYYEVWTLNIGATWRAAFDGVPESQANAATGDFRSAVFFPRPGEVLNVAADRPAPVDGSTLVFDSVDIATTVGARLQKTLLQLNYRATRGAQHVLQLPADASVTEVRQDDVVTPLRSENGALTLPIVPGSHNIAIQWQTDQPVALQTAAAKFDVGAPISNIQTRITLPRERWIIAVGGVGQGPAILYWSALTALLLIAAVLSRIPLTPLGATQWILLGLGFSVFSWPVFFLIAVWLLLLGSKTRWQPQTPVWAYNLAQAALIFMSISALGAIVVSLPVGLLGNADMGITGSGSYGSTLAWLQDRSGGAMPAAHVLSLPAWCFKGLILVWALWLSLALLRWLPWAWQRLSDDGLWRSKTIATAADS